MDETSNSSVYKKQNVSIFAIVLENVLSVQCTAVKMLVGRGNTGQRNLVKKTREGNVEVLKVADLEDENYELKKEVAALRCALKSHGEIVEENYKLRQELSKFKEAKSHNLNGTLYYKEE